MPASGLVYTPDPSSGGTKAVAVGSGGQPLQQLVGIDLSDFFKLFGQLARHRQRQAPVVAREILRIGNQLTQFAIEARHVADPALALQFLQHARVLRGVGEHGDVQFDVLGSQGQGCNATVSSNAASCVVLVQQNPGPATVTVTYSPYKPLLAGAFPGVSNLLPQSLSATAVERVQ